MNDLLNQGWYALAFAWSTAKDEISGHFFTLVLIIALLLLIWNFLSPQVKKRGS